MVIPTPFPFSPWAVTTRPRLAAQQSAAEAAEKAEAAGYAAPSAVSFPFLELGGFVLLVSVAKAVREHGVGEVVGKLRGLLDSRGVEQAVRSLGNVICSIIQAGACNRIMAFAAASLGALVLDQLRLIPRGSSPWVIAAVSVFAGADLVTEGLESIQGLLPFTETSTTDTDFPSTVLFSVENALPDRSLTIGTAAGARK